MVRVFAKVFSYTKEKAVFFLGESFIFCFFKEKTGGFKAFFCSGRKEGFKNSFFCFVCWGTGAKLSFVCWSCCGWGSENALGCCPYSVRQGQTPEHHAPLHTSFFLAPPSPATTLHTPFR